MRSTGIFAILFLAAAASAAEPSAPPVIQAGDVLPLERCIAAALAQDPDLRGLGYAADAAEARLTQDRSVLLPSASATAGYQKNQAVMRNAQDPYSPATINDFNYKTGQVSVSQLLFDFGKRYSSVKATRFLRDAARSRRDAQAVLVSAEVKNSYYNLLQAKRARDLRVEMVEQYKQHLSVAKTRFEAGVRPKYFVTKAETDLSSAELDFLKADKDQQVAQAVLATAMNFVNAPPFDIVVNLDFEKYDITLEDILARSFAQRQDLKALNAQVESARKSLSAARGDLFPAFYASAGYQFGGSISPYTNGWNAGVNLTADLFTGLRKVGKISEAKDLMRQTETQVESLKLQIGLDARKAFLSLQEAEKAIQTATLGVEQAKENRDIAETSYTTGSGTPVEVTDAAVLYSNARLYLITALTNYKLARANIEKTMGMR
ncbi:MAG: TolC family protein [Elusimicrobia bacterium]|nr:TolC family protein [Elusimicrobiota bacterium]